MNFSYKEKPKKLYAYKCALAVDGYILTEFKFLDDGNLDHIEGITRVPEYDIEYKD
jgi:hypothetical protein